MPANCELFHTCLGKSAVRKGNSMVVVLLAALASGGCLIGDGPDQQRKYEFVQNLNRRVGKNLGDQLLIGKLDSNGNFQLELVRERNAMWRLPTYFLMNPPNVVAAYEF